jgi:hypothetical protein
VSGVSTQLNFLGTIEEAFAYYATLFDTEPSVPIQRFGDMPADPGPRAPRPRPVKDSPCRAAHPGWLGDHGYRHAGFDGPGAPDR